MANQPHKLRWAVFILLAGLALAFRLPRLGQRPMHTDESVNAYIVGQVMSGEAYKYDPQDRHGPALCALTLPVVWIAGVRKFADLSEPMLRLMPVILGSLTVLLFASVASRAGFLTTAAAAWLFAFGSLPVYYNRYFIHETPFVFFTLAVMAFGWRTMEKPTIWNCIGIGASASLMLACKETAVLHFAAFGAAAVWWGFVQARSSRKSLRIPKGQWTYLGICAGAALLSFVFIFLILYTWGGRHWQGPVDLIRSYTGFTSRAGGQGHQKPTGYYLSLLAGGWSGGLVLALALFGSIFLVREMVLALRRNVHPDSMHNPGLQALLVYGVCIFAIYSAIPYKTPWLALNFWLPIAFLAGFGITTLWRLLNTGRARTALVVMGCALTFLLSRDSWMRAYVHSFDERNPYAYAHTIDDILSLPQRLTTLAQAKPGHNPRIAVISEDPWPLPWYLRKFHQVGFWQPGQDSGSADFYITSAKASNQFATRLKGWRPEFFGVRPGVLIILWTPPGN